MSNISNFIEIYLSPSQTPPKTIILFPCIDAECADIGGGLSNVSIAVHLFDSIEYICNSLNNILCCKYIKINKINIISSLQNLLISI